MELTSLQNKIFVFWKSTSTAQCSCIQIGKEQLSYNFWGQSYNFWGQSYDFWIYNYNAIAGKRVIVWRCNFSRTVVTRARKIGLWIYNYNAIVVVACRLDCFSN
jgi:hypothetical protein